MHFTTTKIVKDYLLRLCDKEHTFTLKSYTKLFELLVKFSISKYFFIDFYYLSNLKFHLDAVIK